MWFYPNYAIVILKSNPVIGKIIPWSPYWVDFLRFKATCCFDSVEA